MDGRQGAGQKRTDIDTRCTSENKRGVESARIGLDHSLITPMGCRRDKSGRESAGQRGAGSPNRPPDQICRRPSSYPQQILREGPLAIDPLPLQPEARCPRQSCNLLGPELMADFGPNGFARCKLHQ
jgi:hypothetical protein